MAVTAMNQYEMFNDPVHGKIDLHPLCVKIIDTPQFQRLRDIKQIGACYFVYPGASSSSFEHCIGVSHLAGQLARTLQRNQSELCITETDILCVEIAGLCHDIGQGPFSHLFEAVEEFFWKHEEASKMMYDFMLKENKLLDEFAKFGLNEKDITFIVEQIECPKEMTIGKWPYTGRDANKGFLYEIVANKRNGIDVDRWDCFARDCHGLGMKYTFDHNRIIKLARAIKVDDIYQICSRDVEADALYSLFQLQINIQRKAYSHRVCIAVQAMIVDAITAANKTKMIKGKSTDVLKLSECIRIPEAYTNLTDSILYTIRTSTDPNLKDAQHILDRIMHRQLYKCVGEAYTPKPTNKWSQYVNDDKFTKADVIEVIMDNTRKGDLLKENLYVDIVCLNYGSKEENPLNNVRVYNKNKVTDAKLVELENASLLFPGVFSERFIRLYYKTTDTESLKIASDKFKFWCKERKFEEKWCFNDGK